MKYDFGGGSPSRSGNDDSESRPTWNAAPRRFPADLILTQLILERFPSIHSLGVKYDFMD